MKIEIKCRFTGSVLFEHDAKNNSIKLSVIAAVEKKISLRGAYLSGADLSGADLSGAYLSGADLSGAKLKDDLEIDDVPRPILYFGPLGSDAREMIAFSTNKGIRIQTGCFFGTVDEFKAALSKKHADNEHGQEYAAALAMIELHFKLWKKGK